MTFNFRNLDDTTRKLMLDEFKHDEENGELYVSPRLLKGSQQTYFQIFIEVIQNGETEDELALKIQQANILKLTEQRNRNGNLSTAKTPLDKHILLGHGEFNRYYMRALCLRAIEEKKQLQIYRARSSKEPRQSSRNIIGKIVDPSRQLEYLRMNPEVFWQKSGENSLIIEFRMSHPNSGLSLFLV